MRVEPVFRGKTTVIIGGGSSVTAAAIRSVIIARLEDRCRIIAVNDAIYLAWVADWLHAHDFEWWRSNIQRVHRFPGIKTTLHTSVPTAWAQSLRETGRDGFDPDPSACRTGNNSGYQAIHCAIHAAARKIILLGFDMRGPHWFDAQDTDYVAAMAPHFVTLLPALHERNIDAVNCSPGSLLPGFRHAALASEL